MTDISREATLERVPYIWYPVRFRQKNNKDENNDMRALIDSGSEVNAMHPTYTMKLGFRAKKIDFGVQKIDGSHLDSFGIVIADCSVKNELERIQFFQETFLVS